jgi:ZIP family zinc transporter
MLEAFAWAAAAAASLLVAGVLATLVPIGATVAGTIAAFGAGSLIAAVAFELVPAAAELGHLTMALWLLAGAAVYVVADTFIERRFRVGKAAEGQASPIGIVVGSVVDAIPESTILGIGVALGEPLGVAFVLAVAVSNVAEALAPSADLVAHGWPRSRIAVMWGAVVAASGVAGVIGWLAGTQLGITGEAVSAFAAGGLMAMLADSLIPFAFERARLQAGIWVVVGFAAALAMS